MLRQKFINTINETLSKNPKFSVSDFKIEQIKTSLRGIKTILKIKYIYANNYYMNIKIPENKTDLYYEIICENSPGEIELIEKTIVEGTEGVVNHILNWLDLLWDELMAISINNDLEKLKKSLNKFIANLKNIPEDLFTKEEQENYKIELEKLEIEFQETYKEQILEEEKLNEKLQYLHEEFSSLKETLKVFNKKNWARLYSSRVYNWTSKSKDQELFSKSLNLLNYF